MATILSGGRVYRDGRLCREDVRIEEGIVAGFGVRASPADDVIDCDGCIISPGFADPHTHLREPGFSHKETVATATRAAARGGYTIVTAMPNINPTPDTLDHLTASTDIYRRDGVVQVMPVGAITSGQRGQRLSDIEMMAPYVAGYSDDGKGVQSEDMMMDAMTRVHAVDKVILAHCEDDTLRHGGRVHDGLAARRFHLPGILSACEWRQVRRDIELVRRTGCRYHAQHVSCRESVELIRLAKRDGLPITCETAPHYLCLTDEDITDDGRYIMNPPIRSIEDQTALIDGLRDGAVDMIGTDHAPHTDQEKCGGLAQAVMGVAGLECAFGVLYTKLVMAGLITIERLIHAMTDAPRLLLNPSNHGTGGLTIGSPADITIIDISTPYTIDAALFVSMGHSTPFDGWRVYGRPVLTMLGGHAVWDGRGQRAAG